MTRRGEEQAFLGDLRNRREKVGATKFIENPGTLEGGDILVTENQVFVGESRRTNLDGIRQLSIYFGSSKVRRVKTNLFHLLGACSYLSDRRIILAPHLISAESFPGFELILIPKEEAYAANVLYLGDAEVLIPSGYPRTKRKLEEAGYKPVEIENSEFHKGDGSLTCLCSPIYTVL